MKMYYNKVYLL